MDAKVQVGDTTIAYAAEGVGQPLLLIHATAGSRVQWLAVTPLLADRFQVVMPELPGAGETVDPGGPLDIDDLVAQLLAVADAAGFDRFHVAGYSLGAALAAAVAAEAGDRVASATLLFGWARSTPAEQFQFDVWQRLVRADRELFARLLLLQGSSDGFFDLLGDGIDGIAGLIAAGVAPGTDRHAELDARLDISDRLGKITAPTQVVGGDHDAILPPAHSAELAAAIAGAERVEVHGNHLFVLEQPAEVARLVADFALRHPA